VQARKEILLSVVIRN